jgi:PucR family transcriptional regulator, purine catabolism regulatory protein
MQKNLPDVTIGGLVEFRHLSLSVLVRTPDIDDRPVVWAHPTELTDPRPYLRADELVCTVGASLLTTASCLLLVEAVAASRAAGICLGIGDVHTSAPPALVEACRTAGMPLLLMAHGVAFLSINEYLVDRRLRQQSEASSRGGSLLASLLENVRSGSSTAQVLNAAAESLSGRLSMEFGDDSALEAMPEEHPPAEEAKRVSVVAALEGGRSIVWEGAGTAPGMEILAQIGRVILIAQSQEEAAATERRSRLGTLVSLILEGLADSSALRPAIGTVPGLERRLHVSAWPPGTSRMLEKAVTRALVADTGDTVFLITSDPATVYAAASSLGLICGLASPGEAASIAKSLAESRAALRLARLQGQIVGPDRLTTLEGLLFQQPVSRVRPFRDQLIEPLRESGKTRGADLVQTLRSFLAHDGSIPNCAAELFLHVNTVRHRLDRIATLTGRNPLVFLDRVALTIALWAEDQKPERG